MTTDKDFIQQTINDAYAESMERMRKKIIHKMEISNRKHKELVKKRKQERQNRKRKHA